MERRCCNGMQTDANCNFETGNTKPFVVISSCRTRQERRASLLRTKTAMQAHTR